MGSCINTTIKILEITYQLKAVDEQTADLLSTTRHVDFMVQQAHRLRRLKAGLLNASERTMIDTVINDTEDALRAVAKLVEPCRVDKATKNTIKFGHKVMWLFRDNPSVRDKHQKLQICCQSLSTVFSCLYSKDVVVIAPVPEVKSEEQPPPPYDPQMKELLDWQSRRRGRKSLGEKETPPDQRLELTNGIPKIIPAAKPSSPSLLAIELEGDSETYGSIAHTEIFSELLPMPVPDTQSFVCPEIENTLRSVTSTPELSSASVHVGTHDSSSEEKTQVNHPGVHVNSRTDALSLTNDLPRIDSLPFATMIASYDFTNNTKDAAHDDGRNLARTHIPSLDQVPTSSATALDTTPSTTPRSSSLTYSTITTPVSSDSNAGDALGSRWFEPSGNDEFSTPPLREDSTSLGQPPLQARSKSDGQLSTTYQEDRINAVPGIENVMTRNNGTLSVGQKVIKKGGRSWLAYHATRGDMEHGMNSNG